MPCQWPSLSSSEPFSDGEFKGPLTQRFSTPAIFTLLLPVAMQVYSSSFFHHEAAGQYLGVSQEISQSDPDQICPYFNSRKVAATWAFRPHPDPL